MFVDGLLDDENVWTTVVVGGVVELSIRVQT